MTSPIIPESILMVVPDGGERERRAAHLCTVQRSPPTRNFSQDGLGIAHAQPIVFGKQPSPSNDPLTGYQGDFVQLEDGTEQPNGVLNGKSLTLSVDSAARWRRQPMDQATSLI